MKRIISMLIVFLILLCISISVHAASSVYEDKEADIRFEVPTGWSEKPFTKSREFFDKKYVLENGTGIHIILFGATNLWDKLTNSEKSDLSQSDINDSLLTKADIADLLFVDSNSITDTTYNGVHYYECIARQSSEDYEGLTVTLTHLIHIQNGWVYWFEFSGDKNNTHFSDFERMLNSVAIGNSSFTQNNGSVLWIVGVITTLIIAEIAIVIIVKKKKKPIMIQTDTGTPNQDQPRVQTGHSPKMFCHKCGTELPVDSIYCKKCGAKQHLNEE